ncbi:hypothetical protein [Inquilinus sp.]|jgi:hypothetical protein
MSITEQEDAEDSHREAELRRIEAETQVSVAFWNEYERRFGTPADEYCEI